MPKLCLNPPETFDTTVAIPVPNGTANVRMTFRFRDRPAMQAFAESLQGMTDDQAVRESATGWDLDDEFNEANVKRLCDTYIGAGHAIVQGYLRELLGIRK